MSIIVVTGTNTDVGKTIATAALAVEFTRAGKHVHVIKPAQTGEPDGSGDRFTAARLSGGVITTDEFARYPEPLAPNLSARRAGMPQLTLEEIVTRIQQADAPDRIVLVEGAGGLLVRLADDVTLLDVAAALDAPLVVVTSTGLGSLNLAEMTVTVAAHRGVKTLGLIGGSVPADPDLATQLNMDEFPVVTGVPLLGCLEEGMGELGAEEFQARTHLNIEPLLQAK